MKTKKKKRREKKRSYLQRRGVTGDHGGKRYLHSIGLPLKAKMRKVTSER